MAQFAARVKLDWNLDADRLRDHAGQVAGLALSRLEELGLDDSGENGDLTKTQSRHLRTLPTEASVILLKNSISPIPLHKTLVLRDAIKDLHDPRYCQHELLALAKSAVSTSSNLHFGPEVGVQKPKKDAVVIAAWLREISNMALDLSVLRLNDDVPAAVYLSDSRHTFTKYIAAQFRRHRNNVAPVPKREGLHTDYPLGICLAGIL